MKTILVTGDSRGVGLEIVKTILKDSSFRVLGISRLQSDASVELCKEYQDRYIHINYQLGSEDVKDLYLNKIKELGPFYGFVNNAAIAYDDIITNLRECDLENMYRVNVFSPMMICKYMLRDMLLHKTRGSIVHISSISVHTGYKGLAMYASTKGALEAFSKNTAREWGSMGIRSNVVCPGFMNTDMSSSLTDEQKDRIFKRNSMKSEISIKSVAQTVLYLLDEKSSSITGQVIHVDKGTI